MSPWLKVTVSLYALEPSPRFELRHPFSQALIAVYKVRSCGFAEFRYSFERVSSFMCTVFDVL